MLDLVFIQQRTLEHLDAGVITTNNEKLKNTKMIRNYGFRKK